MHGAEPFPVSLDTGQQYRQSQHIGIEHGPAAIARESITRAPDHVDVAGALRDALVENPDALVQQRVQAALEDFLVRVRARRDAELRAAAREDDQRLGIVVPRAIALLVPIEALAVLLAQPPGRMQR